MLKLTRRILNCKKGAALVEYALLVAGVALIGAASIAIFGHKTNDMVAMVAAVLPGAHTDDNAPIISGKIIETTPTAAAAGAATGIGLDVGGILAGNGTSRLGDSVGTGDSTAGGTAVLSDLVLESR